MTLRTVKSCKHLSTNHEINYRIFVTMSVSACLLALTSELKVTIRIKAAVRWRKRDRIEINLI